jgi:putative effector of murein hydrolase LrgA (UPF0299 family)
MLGAFAWLLLFQLVGDLTVWWWKLPVPGPVLGMLLLFAVLVARGSVPQDLGTTSHTLLQHLMLLLVPATAGLMIHFKRLAAEWLPIMLAGVGGAAMTMAVTALTLHIFLDRRPECLQGPRGSP